MKTCVLASGSKGNCTYIETKQQKILIDVGTTCLYIEKALKSLQIEPSEITSIFITHTHTDHIAGLRVFLKKYHPTVYLTEKMYRDLTREMVFPSYQFLTGPITIEDLTVEMVKTSHDASDSVGYIMHSSGHSIVYITDTGYIHMKSYQSLCNHDVYIMESNHDVKMLMDNEKYPYQTKQRILGDHGHLSNRDSAYYLSHFIGENTKHIILAHLSENNNCPELAFDTLNDMLHSKGKSFSHIAIATQHERTEFIEI